MKLSTLGNVTGVMVGLCAARSVLAIELHCSGWSEPAESQRRDLRVFSVEIGDFHASITNGAPSRHATNNALTLTRKGPQNGISFRYEWNNAYGPKEQKEAWGGYWVEFTVSRYTGDFRYYEASPDGSEELLLKGTCSDGRAEF